MNNAAFFKAAAEAAATKRRPPSRPEAALERSYSSASAGSFRFIVASLAALFTFATPAPAAPAIDPIAARLFERAANVYGNAQTLSLDYRVTSDRRDVPAAESGSIVWRKPTLCAQTFLYSGGRGHFAADAKRIYFTGVDGVSGRQSWKGEFGFWTSLPWELPGNLSFLLRGQKISMRDATLRPIAPRKLEGVLCDGALLDLKRVNGDSIRFWFARDSGLLMRESWAVRLPDSAQIAQLQTRYFNIRLNPKLEWRDFVRESEEAAALSESPA